MKIWVTEEGVSYEKDSLDEGGEKLFELLIGKRMRLHLQNVIHKSVPQLQMLSNVFDCVLKFQIVNLFAFE
jgi:hypothetical protein